MDRAQLSKIEKGTVIGVTFNTIGKIYDVLGMKLEKYNKMFLSTTY